MKQLEKALEVLKVKINRYVVSNTDDTTDVVITGGIEVFHRYPVKDFKAINGSWNKIDIHGSGNERVLLPFNYTDVELDTKHLEELIKFRALKAINKEQASSYEVVTKEELKNKIVYIHEVNPNTNSVVLAEQFKINHKHVIEQVFKLAEQNPSVLMGVEYGVYEYESSIPNNGKKSDIKGSTRVVEDSATRTNNITTRYDMFLHISEDVYYRFINSMGKPKSLEMVAYRDLKRQEYLKGFQVLRERVLLSGVKERELEDILKIRTEYTKELMLTIKDYVTHYNNNSGELKQLDYNSTSRLIFNLINSKVGIDAKDYRHKEVDRDKKDKALQTKLRVFEKAVSVAIKAGKRHNDSLKEILTKDIDLSMDEIEKYLNNKNVTELLQLVK